MEISQEQLDELLRGERQKILLEIVSMPPKQRKAAVGLGFGRLFQVRRSFLLNILLKRAVEESEINLSEVARQAILAAIEWIGPVEKSLEKGGRVAFRVDPLVYKKVKASGISITDAVMIGLFLRVVSGRAPAESQQPE